MTKKRSILTQEDIVDALQEIGLKSGDDVIVHMSMKSLGYIVGGEEVVIRALLEAVGEDGTIMMPSQTWKNLDPSKGVHWTEPEEWWGVIREHWPAYDKRVTPAIGMGAVARMFSTWPGVERSDHPARSFAAYGKNAKYLTENHDLANIFGSESPLDKLYHLKGKVLLIGVDHDKNTSIHLSETKADFDKKFTVEHSAVNVNGIRQWISYETQDVDDVDFLEMGNAFDDANDIAIYQMGDAKVNFFDQTALVDWCTTWMSTHRK